ncbi:restriction endonuclease [Leptolyngbya sp. PCC 6406]|uniref:restriction endonuclease n=1 Tax=Leptolyngbya sp. PCC 6406 TaxID=1173264 RepID=UPI0002ACA628|nr:restriction endonuclease [Leptolyngbya sp. PCC 6406]
MTQTRAKISREDNARIELGEVRSNPPWLENQHILPFHLLHPDEFEIFCFLLLRYENPHDDIYYYGKTGDAGRDIVWHKSDGSIELIQCKRYQNNVGIGEIRTEIAKLHVNCYRQTIPENPNSVAFYIVPDLTAPAQDLIDYPSKWLEIAEDVLRGYLNEQPSEGILEFALSWRPKFSKQMAVELTQRAKKYQGLIEEFFGYKKVIDTTALEPILAKLEEIQKSQTIFLQPDASNATVALQNALRKAETENQGLLFSVNQTSQITTISVSAEPSAGSAQFGNLIFPETEAGNQGLEKFRLLVEEGRQVELEPDEYNWRWNINLPEIGSSPFRITTLKLIPNVPEYQIPCMLEVLQDNKVVSRVPFAYFRILRIGTKEIEFCISGGQLQGELLFVSSFERDNTLLTYKGLSLYSIPVKQAKSSIELMLSLYRHGKVRVISLEDEAVLIKPIEANDASSNFNKEEFENAIRFLEKLDKINQAFNLKLLYPENISAEIEEQADSILNSIRKGKIKRTGGTVSLSYTPEQALEILNIFEKDGNFKLTMTTEIEYSFLDQKIDMGETDITLENVSLMDDSESIRAAFIEARDSGVEKVDIRLKCTSSVESYRRWFQENTEENLVDGSSG